MSTLELKQKVLKQIELTENNEVLAEVYRILELGSYNPKETPISNELKTAIDKGLDDYTKGDFVSNEIAKNEFREWLNR
jgi:hypothetical protein